jgi:hypothetical protein
VLLVAHLGEGPTVPLDRNEHRVIAEAGVARGSFGDVALDRAGGLHLCAVRAPHQGHGPKPRRTPSGRHPGQLCQEPIQVGPGVALLPRVTRRVDPRCTAEGIDLQAGVVGNRGTAGGDADGHGLQAGIGLEGVAVLHHVGDLRWPGFQVDEALQDKGDLGHLVRVGAGHHQAWQAGHLCPLSPVRPAARPGSPAGQPRSG